MIALQRRRKTSAAESAVPLRFDSRLCGLSSRSYLATSIGSGAYPERGKARVRKEQNNDPGHPSAQLRFFQKAEWTVATVIKFLPGMVKQRAGTRM